MNPKQILLIFWNRKLIILTAFAACMITAVAALQFVKRQYAASAQLYVNLVDPNGATNTTIPGAVVRNYILTQIETIRSVGTALAVVDREKLDQSPALIEQFSAAGERDGELRDWLASRILQGVVVARQGASDIISITYRSENGDTAARMANAFAESFLRKEIELRSAPAQDLAQWHETQLATLRKRFEEVETERSRLRLEAVRRGDVDAFGTPDPASSLPVALANARNAVINLNADLDRARSGQNPPPDNSEILILRRAVADMERDYNTRLPRLGPEHSSIRTQAAQIANTKQAIATTLERLRAEMIAEKERELAAAQRKIEQIAAQLSQDEGVRHDQSRSRASAVALDRELESLRAQIDGLVQRREKAKIEGAAVMGNISILSRAVPPLAPSWPNVPIILVVAGGLGLAFGFVLAFLREMTDRRVRCVDDLVKYVDAPLLGILPGGKLPHGMAHVPRMAGTVTGPAGSYPMRLLELRTESDR